MRGLDKWIEGEPPGDQEPEQETELETVHKEHEAKLAEIKNLFLTMCEEGYLEFDVDASYDDGHWTNLSKWILRTDPMWFDDFIEAIGVTDADLNEVMKMKEKTK